jgi:hypothetical protein
MNTITSLAAVSTAALTALAALPATAAPPAAASSHSHRVHLNSCWVNAVGVPVLKSLSFTPDAVDTDNGPQQVHFTVHAVDRGADAPGIGSVLVGLDEPGNPDAATSPSNRVMLRHRGGTKWVGSIELPQHGQRVGTWTVGLVELTGKMLPNRLGQPPIRNYFGKDLAAFGPTSFTVSGSAPDDVAPTIDSFSVPSSVDTTEHPKTVRFTVRATDADSGIAKVVVRFYYNDASGWQSPSKQFPLHLHAVPSATDLYRAPVRVPSWVGERAFRFLVQVQDSAGNVTVSGDEPGTSPPATMSVHGHLLRKHRHAARMSDVSVAPAHVDLRSGSRRVTVTAHVQVPKFAPMPRIVTYQYGRNPWQRAWVEPAYAAMHRISGSARNGTWRAHLLLPACTTLAAVKTLSVRAMYADASIGSANPRLHIRTAVHRPPTFVMKHTVVGTDDPASIRFDEAVTGITGHSLVVAEPGHSASTRPRISGSWTCRNGVSAKVDCSDGRVRTATFRPDDPWPADTFSVIADPGHHLALVDLHGNLGRFRAQFSSSAA